MQSTSDLRREIISDTRELRDCRQRLSHSYKNVKIWHLATNFLRLFISEPNSQHVEVVAHAISQSLGDNDRLQLTEEEINQYYKYLVEGAENLAELQYFGGFWNSCAWFCAVNLIKLLNQKPDENQLRLIAEAVSYSCHCQVESITA